jgi:hypothetical protein
MGVRKYSDVGGFVAVVKYCHLLTDTGGNKDKFQSELAGNLTNISMAF